MTDSSDGNVLVTGSNRGLGLEFVRQLAGSANRVFATCRGPQEAGALAALADEHPHTVTVTRLDVESPDSISGAVRDVRAEVDTLHLLVNNAGISGGGPRDDFDSVDQDTLLKTFRVNAAGPHLLVRAFSGLLGDRGRERRAAVVNITSGYGSISNASGGGWHSYKASKAALNMFTRIQADELRREDVTVVAMDPGWVQTDMGGSGARLSPEESVSGILDVIGSLTLDDTGLFLDHRGRERAW